MRCESVYNQHTSPRLVRMRSARASPYACNPLRSQHRTLKHILSSHLDARLIDRLRLGDIRLLRVEWLMQQADDYRIERLQDLERYEAAYTWVVAAAPPRNAVYSSSKQCVVRSNEDGKTYHEIGKYSVEQGVARCTFYGAERSLKAFEFLVTDAHYEWLQSAPDGAVPANAVSCVADSHTRSQTHAKPFVCRRSAFGARLAGRARAESSSAQRTATSATSASW